MVGLGEEPGWRGWMLSELQKRCRPCDAARLVWRGRRASRVAVNTGIAIDALASASLIVSRGDRELFDPWRIAGIFLLVFVPAFELMQGSHSWFSPVGWTLEPVEMSWRGLRAPVTLQDVEVFLPALSAQRVFWQQAVCAERWPDPVEP